MGVRMTHPDIDQEIVVASSAVPIHENSGWKAVPGQEDMGEQLPPELQRFEGQDQVRLRHPDVAQDITVARSAVPYHRSVGWQEVDAAERESLEGKTLDDLKDAARNRGLPVSGTKAELIERLTEDAVRFAEGTEEQDTDAGDEPADEEE